MYVNFSVRCIPDHQQTHLGYRKTKHRGTKIVKVIHNPLAEFSIASLVIDMFPRVQLAMEKYSKYRMSKPHFDMNILSIL